MNEVFQLKFSLDHTCNWEEYKNVLGNWIMNPPREGPHHHTQERVEKRHHSLNGCMVSIWVCARGSSSTLAQGAGELLWDAMILPGMLGYIRGEQDGHTLGPHEARTQSQLYHQMVWQWVWGPWRHPGPHQLTQGSLYIPLEMRNHWPKLVMLEKAGDNRTSCTHMWSEHLRASSSVLW